LQVKDRCVQGTGGHERGVLYHRKALLLLLLLLLLAPTRAWCLGCTAGLSSSSSSSAEPLPATDDYPHGILSQLLDVLLYCYVASSKHASRIFVCR
jgi:hypothetical protein